jgi:hypothetical protein
MIGNGYVMIGNEKGIDLLQQAITISQNQFENQKNNPNYVPIMEDLKKMENEIILSKLTLCNGYRDLNHFSLAIPLYQG